MLLVVLVVAACGGGHPKAMPDASVAIDAAPDASLAPAVAPANVTATPGNRVVAIAWNPVEGATRYLVGRATSPGGTRTMIADASGPISDTNVTNGVTYYYAVAARNGYGQGPWSNEVAATPNEPIPAAPASLVATGRRSRVELAWNAAANANDYRLARAVVSGGPYITVATIATTSFVDTTVVDNTRYYYVVYARSGGGESPQSNEATALPTDTIPTKPTGLATIVGREVTVTWDAATAATEYLLWRASSANGPWEMAARVPGRSATDRKISGTVPWWFRVTALGAGGESDPSDAISATLVASAAHAPGYLRAIPGKDAITLMWLPQTPTAHQFQILRSDVPGGPYTPIATTMQKAVTDTSPSSGTAYYVARTLDKPSAYSNEVAAATSTLLPATPNVTAIQGRTHATLHWPPVPGATRYIVRSYDAFRTAVLHPQGPSVDVELTTTPEEYYVTAVIGDRESAWSRLVTVATDAAALHRPRAHALGGSDRVSLTWGAIAGATGYRVLRASTTGGPYSEIATTTASSYSDTTASGDVFYRVQAIGSLDSAWSAEVAATVEATRPPAPNAPNASFGSGWASLTWSAVPGATQYIVSRRYVGWHEPAVVAMVPGTSYVDENASNGTSAYTVTATIAGRAGAPSPETVVTTAETLAPLPASKVAVAARDGSVRLGWNVRSGTTTSRVMRATTPGGPYTEIAAIPTTASILSYEDTSVTNDVAYYYVVTADSGGARASSTEIAATPSATPPPAPTASARGGRTAIALQWDHVARASTYRVYRSTTSGSGYALVASPTGAIYTDTNVTDGTTYFYRIAGVSSSSTEGALSSEVAATPSSAAPESPQLAEVTSGNDQVFLRWVGSGTYRIWRADRPDGPFAPLATTSATTYRDRAVAIGETWFYAVTAIGNGESVPSEVGGGGPQREVPSEVTNVAVDVSGAPTVSWNPVAGARSYSVCMYFGCYSTTRTHYAFDDTPAGPVTFHVIACGGSTLDCSAPSEQVSAIAPPPLGDVQAGVTAGNREVGVYWPAFPNASSYRIWRSDAGSERYTLVGTTTDHAFRVTGLRNGLALDVAVTAITPSGETAWSYSYPVTTTETLAVLPQTATLQAGSDAVTITHDRVVGVDAYRMEVASALDGPYADPTSGHRFATSTTLLGTGTTYARFYTCNTLCSGFFGPIAMTTNAARPATPTGMALQVGNGEISMTWNAVPGATAYRIYRTRSYPNQFPYEPIATVARAPFIDRTVENEIDYVYTVAAINGAGEGALAQADANQTTPQAPRAPLGVQAQAAANKITLSWERSIGASGYLVCRSTNAHGPFNTCTFGGNSGYVDVGLSPGTYYYAIIAYTAGTQSALSPIASATVN